MTTLEMQAESLDRATNGQSLVNYATIFEGFRQKGIAAADIRPRENVFTFNAWKALGRVVKKGEHGVQVLTFVSGSRRTKDGQPDGQPDGQRVTFKMPRTVTVFHISQTQPLTTEA
jgi:antirestriction protein ArdC